MDWLMNRPFQRIGSTSNPYLYLISDDVETCENDEEISSVILLNL